MADSTFPLARLSVVTVIHCKPTATHCNRRKYAAIDFITGVMSCKTRHCLCNTLHYTATEGNTLQQTTHGRLGIFCNDSYLSLQHTAIYCIPGLSIVFCFTALKTITQNRYDSRTHRSLSPSSLRHCRLGMVSCVQHNRIHELHV